jgi:hypothetical protein
MQVYTVDSLTGVDGDTLFLGHHALDRKFLEENFTFPDPSTPSLQDLDSA